MNGIGDPPVLEYVKDFFSGCRSHSGFEGVNLVRGYNFPKKSSDSVIKTFAKSYFLDTFGGHTDIFVWVKLWLLRKN
jgi:hypothetical protein